MRVLGLTGGIGCGKSTVAKLFARWGVEAIDADQIARDVVAVGTEGLAEVVRAFGPEILAADGTLDRKRLASVVFANDERRRELNGILHPRIGMESAARMARLAERGHGFALYEAALLVENRVHGTLDGLIVVAARVEVQRMRIIERDGIDAAEADARIRAQLPLASKVAVATHVIDNSSTRARLEARVAALYAELVVAYGSPRGSGHETGARG